MSADRGRDSSRILTDARTVLSRAETAMRDAERREARRAVDAEYRSRYPLDPDEGRIIGALNEVVALLSEWRRTGRPRRG